MKTKNLLAAATGVTAFLMMQAAEAQSTAMPARTSSDSAMTDRPSDNSKNNKLDSNRAVTADDQKNDTSDMNLTREIRKNVMADKSLSTYAHNVKIVVVNGSVTLNGVVRSGEEKTKVTAIARQVAGRDHVVDELKIAPPKS